MYYYLFVPGSSDMKAAFYTQQSWDTEARFDDWEPSEASLIFRRDKIDEFNWTWVCVKWTDGGRTALPCGEEAAAWWMVICKWLL